MTTQDPHIFSRTQAILWCSTIIDAIWKGLSWITKWRLDVRARSNFRISGGSALKADMMHGPDLAPLLQLLLRHLARPRYSGAIMWGGKVLRKMGRWFRGQPWNRRQSMSRKFITWWTSHSSFLPYVGILIPATIHTFQKFLGAFTGRKKGRVGCWRISLNDSWGNGFLFWEKKERKERKKRKCEPNFAATGNRQPRDWYVECI